MSFVEFVAETELGRGYVSELERGLVVPNVDVLDRSARALGVSLHDLVTFPEDGNTQRLLDLTRHLRPAQVKGLLKEVEQLVARSPARS